MSSQDNKKDQEAVKLAQMIVRAREDQMERWPMLLEMYAMQAKEAHAQYLAFVKAGFTEEQSVQLCKKG